MHADSDIPHTRRLQARAAKSALRYYKKLMNPKVWRIASQNITDPDEKLRAKQRMRNDAQSEIDYIARKLKDLVPTDGVLPYDGDILPYHRLAKNGSSSLSPVVQRLLREGRRAVSTTKSTALADDIDYLNPWSSDSITKTVSSNDNVNAAASGEIDNAASSLQGDEFKTEFLDEWLRQKNSIYGATSTGNISTSNTNADDDDDINDAYYLV